MDLIEEMAALGLPTSFVSRSEIHENKSTKKCSDSKLDKEAAENFEATDSESEVEPWPCVLFSVRSVKLYTAKQPGSEEITLDCLQALDFDYECGAVEAEVSVDGLEPQEKEQECGGDETELPENVEDCTEDALNVQVGAGEVASNGLIWEPVWDEQYQRYYFCNTQSWESTWDPPPGYEEHGSNPGDSTECSGVDHSPISDPSAGVQLEQGLSSCLQDINAVLDYARDSSAADDQQEEDMNEPDECLMKASIVDISSFNSRPMAHDPPERPSFPSVVVEGEEALVQVQQTSSTVRADPADCASIQRLEMVTSADFVPENSPVSKGEDQGSVTDSLPIFPRARACGVHTRFSDSDDSTLVEAVDVDGINISWEEIEEPQSAARSGDGRQDGTEACSHSLATAALTDPKRSAQLSRERIKRRRVKSLSKSESLEKLLLAGMPEMMSKTLVKYWLQRYSLFSRYDEGVKLDDEGWFSVTPEIIAEHQASRCPRGLIVDAFAGVGGNAIQFALKKNHVVAIDNDPTRVDLARHNAQVYGVSDRIEFIVGDFFRLAPFLKADLVFLSPPWGGPEYLNEEKYDIQTMLQPKDGFTLFKTALTIAPNLALFLPRNVDLLQLKELAWLSSPPLPCQVEKNYVNNRLKAITAYYGDVALQTSE